jgi:maleate isomerase
MDDRTTQVEFLLKHVQYDQGRHWRAKLGFVILAMEQTIEEDMFRLAPPGVGVHFARAPMSNEVTVETLENMASGLAGTAALLLPEGNLDVVCYGCTSGSIVIGEDRVIAELLRGSPNARATTLVTGVVRALRAFQAKRIVVATPYLDEINVLEADYFRQQGFEVLDIQGLNISQDCDMVRVAPDFIFEFARSLDRPDTDAIFVSCGALRTVDILEKLEQTLGKPVVSSNQAMMWDTLRLAGIEDKIEGCGQLFQRF